MNKDQRFKTLKINFIIMRKPGPRIVKDLFDRMSSVDKQL